MDSVLDPGILLAAKPLQVPNPITLASQGLSLADLANRNQLMNFQLQQQADIPNAMQSIQGITDPEQAAQVLMRDHPRAAQVLVPMIRDLALKSAQTQEALGKGQQATAEAANVANKAIANVAYQESQNPDPMSVARIQRQAQFFGKTLPDAPDPNDLGAVRQWASGVGSGNITPEQATQMALNKATIPLRQAETLKAATEAQYAGPLAQATIAEKRAQAANIFAPKVEVDPFGRPLILQRFGQPSISMAPSAGAPAQPQPMTPTMTTADGMSAADQQTAAADFARTGGVPLPSGAPAAQAGAPIASPGMANAQAIANYQAAPPNRSTPFGAMVYDQVRQINPNYDQALWDAKDKTTKTFSEGPEASLLRSQNVAIAHMATLDQLGQALKNGNMQLFNQLSQQIAAQTGSAVPTNFNAAAQIVGKEVAKAVIQGGGGEGERDAILQTFSQAKSPDQIAGAINTYQQLLGGQMMGLKRQYEAGTDPLKTGQTDFSKFVAPETQAVLDRVQAAPAAVAGKRTATSLPDPSTLNEGDIVTNNTSGKKLVVRNGRYQPL